MNRRVNLVFPLPILILGITMIIAGMQFSEDFLLVALGLLLAVGSVAGFLFILRSRKAIRQDGTTNSIPSE